MSQDFKGRGKTVPHIQSVSQNWKWLHYRYHVGNASFVRHSVVGSVSKWHMETDEGEEAETSNTLYSNQHIVINFLLKRDYLFLWIFFLFKNYNKFMLSITSFEIFFKNTLTYQKSYPVSLFQTYFHARLRDWQARPFDLQDI